MRFPYGILGLVFAVLLGAMIGVGTFTFGYAKGFSYFSTDPTACINCHIMNEQYDSWLKSSHHAVAGCVDCHLPHDFVGKYIAKADNGYRHSWAFTFLDNERVIRITDRNARILKTNCIQCHETTVHEMNLIGESLDDIACVRCHADVGHGAR